MAAADCRPSYVAHRGGAEAHRQRLWPGSAARPSDAGDRMSPVGLRTALTRGSTGGPETPSVGGPAFR